jgi:hypothetical protein
MRRRPDAENDPSKAADSASADNEPPTLLRGCALGRVMQKRNGVPAIFNYLLLVNVS